MRLAAKKRPPPRRVALRLKTFHLVLGIPQQYKARERVPHHRQECPEEEGGDEPWAPAPARARARVLMLMGKGAALSCPYRGRLLSGVTSAISPRRA
jgi:hypothetical protein